MQDNIAKLALWVSGASAITGIGHLINGQYAWGIFDLVMAAVNGGWGARYFDRHLY